MEHWLVFVAFNVQHTMHLTYVVHKSCGWITEVLGKRANAASLSKAPLSA